MVKASLLAAALLMPAAALAQGMSGQGKAQGNAQQGGAMFQELDSDGNGSLSWNEVAQRHRQVFSSLDQNGDQRLSKDEFTNARGLSQQMQSARGERFAGFDKNSDGHLSFDEYSTGHRSGFQRADADKNGEVSQQELSMVRQGQTQ